MAKGKQEEHSEGLPIRMLHDRLLVSLDGDQGERRSGGGILIPATASVGRRLAWGEVVATADYAVFVELGTTRMAEQPFMRPAAARRAPGFIKAIEQLADGS